jgi:hypothetical protein
MLSARSGVTTVRGTVTTVAGAAARCAAGIAQPQTIDASNE